MAKQIIVKPLISEKAERLSGELDVNQYTFIVNKKANKVEIRKAVENMYGVSVNSVNTLIMPAKMKTRNTKTGVQKGFKSSYKKAIVTVAEGEVIDYYGDV